MRDIGNSIIHVTMRPIPKAIAIVHKKEYRKIAKRTNKCLVV